MFETAGAGVEQTFPRLKSVFCVMQFIAAERQWILAGGKPQRSPRYAVKGGSAPAGAARNSSKHFASCSPYRGAIRRGCKSGGCVRCGGLTPG